MSYVLWMYFTSSKYFLRCFETTLLWTVKVFRCFKNTFFLRNIMSFKSKWISLALYLCHSLFVILFKIIKKNKNKTLVRNIFTFKRNNMYFVSSKYFHLFCRNVMSFIRIEFRSNEVKPVALSPRASVHLNGGVGGWTKQSSFQG